MSIGMPLRNSETRRTYFSLASDEGVQRISYPRASQITESRRPSLFIKPPSVYIEKRGPHKAQSSEIHQLMDDMGIRNIHDYDKADERDVLSRNPSFTREFFSKFNSLQKYRESTERYEKQFQREIEQLLIAQPTAYEAARLQRHLSYTTFWPPLHNRRELARSKALFFPYTKKQKRRLRLLLLTDIR